MSTKLYFKSVKNIPIVSKEKCFLLIKKAQKGNKEARNEIIKLHLKLVIKISKRYHGYHNLDWDDIISAGNLGLFRAIKKFDLSSGYAFTTYASYWIKQYIIRFINANKSIIRKPEYICQVENKIKKNIKVSAFYRKLYLKTNYKICSYDIMTGANKDTIFGEIATKDPPSINKKMMDINLLLDKLNANEKKVLQLRLQNVTLEEIGNRMRKISRERVRQIEKIALTKLHNILNYNEMQKIEKR